jgi:SAM-dependent methyltransferase
MTGSVVASPEFLKITGAAFASEQALSVLFDGRRVWTFRADEGFLDEGGDLVVPWPPALAERLHGYARLGVAADGTVLADGVVAFDGTGAPLRLVDPGTGTPLVVNKWGRLAKSFEGRDSELIEGVLRETERLIAVVRDRLGHELFVTGGTLLGPVRDGRMLPHDDDADLAYLSKYENPSDIVLEALELERVLLDSGYEIVRHSMGHLQLMFPGDDVTDAFYIDIFTYFVCDGWFYGTFHAREPADSVTLLPTTLIDVNGHPLPAPAVPESLLAAIYGPGWATPDPAFRFVTPPAAARRYFWWLNHYDFDRENWEQTHRTAIGSGDVPGPSEFAQVIARRLDGDERIVELGCGLGSDAGFFADRGHGVRAVDFSRPALVHARRASAGLEHPPVYERVNLNSDRDMVRLWGRCSPTADARTHLYARHLFNALSPLGWDVALRFIRHALRRTGGLAHLELDVGEQIPRAGWNDLAPRPLETLLAALDRYSLDVEHEEHSADGSTSRVTVRSRS